MLDIIRNIKVNVIIITKNNSKLSDTEISNYNEQYHNLKVIYNDDFHDRFFIIDNKKIYHCGSSINHIGKRIFMINLLEETKICDVLLNEINNIIN